MKIKHIKNFNNYNKTVTEKTHICLHTTGGHNASSVINWWKTRNNGKGTVSTPYLIDRNGIIHQLFSPQYWSHHTGSGHDKRLIGIEIENAGVCKMGDDNQLKNDLGVKPYDFISWVDENGEQHYHETFTPQQVKALKELLVNLTHTFEIPYVFADGENVSLDKGFGVVTHRQLKETKTDIPVEVLEEYEII